MGEEKRERLDTTDSGQNVEIQKLGWLSSYSRQVLLSRHALRTFYVLTDQMIRFEADTAWKHSNNTADDALRLLRALIEILSGINKSSGRISAPYEPIDKPVTFFLGESRLGRMVAVSTRAADLSGLSQGTSFSTNGLSTRIRANWISQKIDRLEKSVLADEIALVRKGVSLSNKSMADERCEKLILDNLWPQKKDDNWQAHQLFAPFNEALNSAFEFWEKWYQGFLDGKPLDWELQRRVALIPDDDWEKGPEHIAQKIEEIKAKWLAEQTPLAEKVEFNPEIQKFQTVPIDISKPDLLGATLSHLEDALDDVLIRPSNGLHDGSHTVRVLRRVFTKYGNDPQQIEMGLVTAHKGITRQFLTDEMPQSEENLALCDALEEGARAIRATHPEVAENRNIRNHQALREMPKEDLELLEDAKPLLAAWSADDLAEDWEYDIPQLINDATLPLPSGAPPLPGADEATRIFSRAAKMKLSYDALVTKGAEAFDSKTMKTTRLGLTLGGLLTALVSMGLRLFGLI